MKRRYQPKFSENLVFNLSLYRKVIFCTLELRHTSRHVFK